MQLSLASIAKLSLAFLAATSFGADTEREWKGYVDTLNAQDTAPEVVAEIMGKVKNKFKDRHEVFLKNLKADGIERFILNLSGAENVNAFKSKNTNIRNSFETIVRSLSNKDLVNMDKDLCHYLTYGLNKFNNADAIPAACRDAYIKSLQAGKVPLASVSGIPVKWVTESPKNLAVALSANMGHMDNETLGRLNSATWTALVGEDKGENNTCKYLDAELLNKLKAGMHAKVSAACIAEIKGLENVKLEQLNKYSDSIFSRFDGILHPETISQISAAQISSYGTKSNNQRCASLDISKLSATAMASLNGECLLNRMKNFKDRSSTIGQNLAKVPTEALTKADCEEVFGYLNPSDYVFLNTDVIQHIINKEDVLSKMERVESGVPFKQSSVEGVTVTAESFARLAKHSIAMASQVLTAAKTLPENVLSQCDAEIISTLYMPSNQSISGFGLLASLKNKNPVNFAKIIASMSEESNNGHICSKITSFQAFSEMKWLHANIGKSCIDNMGFEIDAQTMAKCSIIARSDNAGKQAIEKFSTDDWKSLGSKTMAIFVKSEDFCSALAESKDIISNLNDQCLKELSPQCVYAAREQITDAMVGKLADNAFALFTADTMKFDINKIKISQIPHISSQLTEAQAANHYFAAMTLEAINALEAARFDAISGHQWAFVKKDVLKTLFTVEKVKTIKPASLTGLTDAHLEIFSEEVLLAFTAEQISSLGREVDAELKPFDKLTAKLDEARQKAITTRREEIKKKKEAVKPAKKEEVKESSNTWIWWLAGSCGVVVVIGGVVFMIMRNRQASHFSK